MSCPAPPLRPTPPSAGPSSTCTSWCWDATTPSIPTEVARTFDLFAGIVADARTQKNLDQFEIYESRANVPDAPADPHYTIRAWRAVLTYLFDGPSSFTNNPK